jgi:hypothetical protein
MEAGRETYPMYTSPQLPAPLHAPGPCSEDVSDVAEVNKYHLRPRVRAPHRDVHDQVEV